MLFFPAPKLPFDTGTGKYFSRFVIKHLHLCCSHAQRSAVALHPMNVSSVWEIQSSTSLQAEGWISVCVCTIFSKSIPTGSTFPVPLKAVEGASQAPKLCSYAPGSIVLCGQVGHTVHFEE